MCNGSAPLSKNTDSLPMSVSWSPGVLLTASGAVPGGTSSCTSMSGGKRLSTGDATCSYYLERPLISNLFIFIFF